MLGDKLDRIYAALIRIAGAEERLAQAAEVSSQRESLNNIEELAALQVDMLKKNVAQNEVRIAMLEAEREASYMRLHELKAHMSNCTVCRAFSERVMHEAH